MPNRVLVTDATIDHLDEVPQIGLVRIWQDGSSGQPTTRTELVVVYVEPNQAGIPPEANAKAIPASRVKQFDDRLGSVFASAGVNILDYGPAMRRGFSADVIMPRPAVEELRALFEG